MLFLTIIYTDMNGIFGLLSQDAESRDELQKSAELTRLTDKYGTKMAYLIFYLRNLFNANKDTRVIIFSQVMSMHHLPTCKFDAE